MAQINLPESITRQLYDSLRPHKGLPFAVSSSASVELGHLTGDRFVAKPDYPFGKRGKNQLIGLNLDAHGVKDYLKRMTGSAFGSHLLNRFIVTPFIAHDEECYLSFKLTENGDEVSFSSQGGIEVESNWKSLQTVTIPFIGTEEGISRKLSTLVNAPEGLEYLKDMYGFFRESSMTFLEINPCVFVNGQWLSLDCKATLDSAGLFKLQKHVDIHRLLEITEDSLSPAERYVKQLDSSTGASLKLKVFNANGRIWPLVAGGGASLIVFDALVAAGLGGEIAFYGEYSGNPPFEIVYRYAKTILDLAVKSSATNKTILILGGNANFTNVFITVRGIAQAIEELAPEIRRQKISIAVRRPGPQDTEAYAVLSALAETCKISIQIYPASQSLVAPIGTISNKK